MTIEANRPFAPGEESLLRFPTRVDRALAIRKARRHTRLVRVVRVAFPVLALLIAGLYFLSPRLRVSIGGMEASVERVEVNKSRLRMINPRLEGVNAKKEIYVVTAEYAEQELGNTSTVHLHEVKADLTNPREGWTRMTAPKGTFYTKEEKLDLFGGIKVATSGGIVANLQTAHIDMTSQRITSDDPIEVEMLNGTVRSDRVEIESSSRRILFIDRVRVHMLKHPKTEPANRKAETR